MIKSKINKDMNDTKLIDVETLDLVDDQVWLHKTPDDAGDRLDIVDWCLSLDWPVYNDSEYEATEKRLYEALDEILNEQVLGMPDKHRFDSSTYVKPKRQVQRPSIQQIVEHPTPPSTSPLSSMKHPTSTPSSTSPLSSLNTNNNKYLTYNKYNAPLGPIMRHKTFNVDANTDNSTVIKEYAMKRRSLVQDDDPQLEDMDMTLMDMSERLSETTKPINIDLSQPAHNLHNTFNKGITNMQMLDRASLNMYQSGESLMRQSPPSLVSSLMMESTNAESLPDHTNNQRSLPSRLSGPSSMGRESIDPMMTSMTLSILEEKDMSTSFLSQTTYPDHDSFLDSLPPSLVSSVNSSYIVKRDHNRDSTESNVFSSATFTHLEQSERLLTGRPRCSNMYNSFTKRDSLRNSESYTKSREEACQIDAPRILNEKEKVLTSSSRNIESPISNEHEIVLNRKGSFSIPNDERVLNRKESFSIPNDERVSNRKESFSISHDEKVSRKTESSVSAHDEGEITLHYSNNKFRRNANAEKENVNSSFEKDDAFYKEMGMTRTVDLGKNSMNVTLDKQELNEIIQARQKLSLARRGLPTDADRLCTPNQASQEPRSSLNTMTITKKSGDNTDLLGRRKQFPNGHSDTFDKREPIKRNATFRRPSPGRSSMDTTVVFVKADDKMIDINSATVNLVDIAERNRDEWGSQQRAMVGSSESTDTATFSSSSPPDSVPDTQHSNHHTHVASTPLTSAAKKSLKIDLMPLHTTISPIFNLLDDKSYTLTKANSTNSNGTYDVTENYDREHNATVINSGTIVKRSAAKRDILAGRVSPEKRVIKSPNKPIGTVSQTEMAPPTGLPRKTGLPTSKLRQYSSHKELRIPVANGSNNPVIARTSVGRNMVRRNVYASNPALSPTAPSRRESYTIAKDEDKPVMKQVPVLVRQGTETLRPRPQSQLMQPKDLRGSSCASGVPMPSMRNHQGNPPSTRPYSIAGASQLRVSRPTSVPPPRVSQAPPVANEPRPASGSVVADARTSALPRPTRLPGPRRGLRPPSAYSVAPHGDDHY